MKLCSQTCILEDILGYVIFLKKKSMLTIKMTTNFIRLKETEVWGKHFSGKQYSLIVTGMLPR